jgi:hypothetical protein
MALIKVYEVREQRETNPAPESRGSLVAVFTTFAEAFAKADALTEKGRNVAVYTAYTTDEAVNTFMSSR